MKMERKCVVMQTKTLWKST